MSSCAVTAERLTILPHPNADALELAAVGKYRAVVRKGQYRTGDVALYIPEAAILPDELIRELGLTGRLTGKARNRVKAVRLRGELSQGIVCSPAALSDADLTGGLEAGTDFSERLGITKWVPDVPVNLAGKAFAAADFVPWIDIENIKRFPNIFTTNEPVEATEKIHGSACAVTWFADGRLLVSSKGLGQAHLAIAEDDANSYWRAVRTHRLDEVCAKAAKEFGADVVALFGEVYGAGIQDLHYGTDHKHEPSFAAFDARISVRGDLRWLERDELAVVTDGVCRRVPVLYEGPYDYEVLAELAEGPETVSGTAAHTREGLVIRPVPERYSTVTGGRAIAKLVGGGYLTRKGGTEYE